jgi:hypothetical protein
MVKLGIITQILSIKASFAKLPSEAKTSYAISAIALLIVSSFVVYFFIPKDKGNLLVPGSGIRLANNKGGVSAVNTSTLLPESLANDISKNRAEIESNSNVVFARYSDMDARINQRKENFLNSLRVVEIETPEPIEITKDDTESKTVIESNEFLNTDAEDVNDNYSGDMFLGVVDKVSTKNGDSQIDQIRALLRGQDVAKAWMNAVNESSRVNTIDKAMGATVAFAPSVVNENSEPLNITNKPENKAPVEKYSGDDFLPGRIILARIDGYIESDTQTPFVRLKPVEGQADWVNDAIFLAQPKLVEGQGFRIDVEKLTWKNNSGAFKAVVVSPDEKRNSLVVDEIDSREATRLAYLFFGGALSGVNTLASQLGGSVVTNNGNQVNTGVEINNKNLAISAAGGIGSRAENYLMSKVSTTKDNHILHVNKLVGLMIIEKPDLDWLPSLNNNSVY